nr:helix-turn-helix transcriptional regulator [Falsiroseomonas frigidaquae]
MPTKRTTPTEPFTTLTQWREARGLTQEQVGNKLGLGSAAIHKWEAGKVVPNVDRLRQLAEIYETTPDALFYPPEAGRHVEELRRADALLRRMSPEQADRWLTVAEDLLGISVPKIK